MLIQSQLGYIQFLPALPKQWETGYVKGIVARGNFVIDINWTDGTADSFAVTSRNGNLFTAEYKDLSTYAVKDSCGNDISVEKLGNDKISFPTKAGETYTITRK